MATAANPPGRAGARGTSARCTALPAGGRTRPRRPRRAFHEPNPRGEDQCVSFLAYPARRNVNAGLVVLFLLSWGEGRLECSRNVPEAWTEKLGRARCTSVPVLGDSRRKWPSGMGTNRLGSRVRSCKQDLQRPHLQRPICATVPVAVVPHHGLLVRRG